MTHYVIVTVSKSGMHSSFNIAVINAVILAVN